MSFKCLVCDFDGTIADTFEQAFRIFNELAGEHGFRRMAPEDAQRARGMTVSQFLRFAGVSKRRMPRILLAGRSKLAREADRILPVAGMDTILRTLRPQLATIGILTSNSTHNVRTFASARDLNLFDFVSSVPKLSGKAKYLQAIMMTFSVTEDEILYVGDEARDVRAARKAGVPVAAVTWGFNSAEILRAGKPDYVINKPAELLGLCCPEQ